MVLCFVLLTRACLGWKGQLICLEGAGGVGGGEGGREGREGGREGWRGGEGEREGGREGGREGWMTVIHVLIRLYREKAIAIESEARDPFGGHVYHVTMQITFPIPEFARKEHNLHCDVVRVTTKWVSRLVVDHAIAAIQTSR